MRRVAGPFMVLFAALGFYNLASGRLLPAAVWFALAVAFGALGWSHWRGEERPSINSWPTRIALLALLVAVFFFIMIGGTFGE